MIKLLSLPTRLEGIVFALLYPVALPICAYCFAPPARFNCAEKSVRRPLRISCLSSKVNSRLKASDWPSYKQILARIVEIRF